MDKHQISAILSYFLLLIFVVLTAIIRDTSIINLGYLVVILCCILKLIFIINYDKW